MRRRGCTEPGCEDGHVPVDLTPCPYCQPEKSLDDSEERAERKKTEVLSREVGDWYVRALGTVAAYQHYGMEVPRLSYQMMIFGTLSGDHQGMIKYLKEYVAEGQKAFESKEGGK